MMAQAAATMPMMVSNGSVLMVCSSGMVTVHRGFDLLIIVGASDVMPFQTCWSLLVLPVGIKKMSKQGFKGQVRAPTD